MKIIKSQERGLTQIDWLTSYHSFSFGDYIDPNNRGFGNLRVINDDEIAPASGFGMHPHWNMEIVTYVFEGSLEHQDSMGNQYLIKAGDVQRISAGTGIEHSEFNPSADTRVKLMQIWILPNTKGTVPSYEHKNFSKTENFQLIISPDGRDGSLSIKQDMDIYVLRLAKQESFNYQIKKSKAWIQIIHGSVKINGNFLADGDALAIDQAEALNFTEADNLELLVFDMA